MAFRTLRCRSHGSSRTHSTASPLMERGNSPSSTFARLQARRQHCRRRRLKYFRSKATKFGASMNRFIISLILALVMGPVHAELHPPARILQPIADTSMVVTDRGAKLEIYPTQRATPQLDPSSRVVSHYVVRASAAAAIGPGQLGVVFNHAMQTQGYISGEIAFKVKGGGAFT